MKTFIKYFFSTLLIFTLLFTPARHFFGNIFDLRLFSGTENLAEELGVDTDNPFYDEFEGQSRVNILLLGVNSNMTDTIMLVSYDLKHTKVDVISIPRDTYYARSGYSGASRKINAIYQKDKAVGTAKAVSDTLLGMPINYYAVIHYEGVEKIVEAMGGIPMNIPFDMKYKDPYDKPPLVIDIKKGQQVLDGKEAVQFLRYRKGYPTGDLGRIEAQQEFVKSAFKQMLSFKLPTIAGTILDNVDSDLNAGMVTKLALKSTGLKGDAITTYTLPGAPKTVDGLSFFFADSEKTSEMLTEIFSEPVSDEETPQESDSDT